MTRAPAAWALDGEGFARLLALFDRDRDAAAVRYEQVRRRLVKLFEWRGCREAEREDLADRTFDRVARKLLEGAAINAPDPYAYIHGIALNVLRESWRDPRRDTHSLDPDHADAAAPEPNEEDAAALEGRHACLDSCLGALAPAQRTLLLEYHAGDRHIERRRQLAAGLGIPLNALRIRVHRIRAGVERCVEACCRGKRSEMNPRAAH